MKVIDLFRQMESKQITAADAKGILFGNKELAEEAFIILTAALTDAGYLDHLAMERLGLDNRIDQICGELTDGA